jgi:hypothetical protein
MMRRVLLDHARSRGYQKRGGGAVEEFAVIDARKAKVIELRFFCGLSVEETAEVLPLSTDTIKPDWRLAKLWLLRALEGETVERR